MVYSCLCHLHVILHLFLFVLFFLTQVLGTVVQVLIQDHEMRKTEFHQLAYHRIFIILLLELNQPEPVLEAINYQVLQTFRYTSVTHRVMQFMILEMWELGYNLREMKDCQALYSENDFWAPVGNSQPSDDRWDALSIELPRLRWRARRKFDIYVRSKRKPLYINNDGCSSWF